MRAYLSEFLGTFQLVLIGTGSVLVVQNEGILYPQLWIGIAFGFAVFLGITLFGKASGAHMNPAVTLALWVDGNFEKAKVPGYLGSQIMGAIAASAVVYFVYPSNPHFGDTLPTSGVWQSFLLEFGLTFALMAGVIAIVHWKAKTLVAALVIGSIVGLEAYFAGPLCGASMNPARSISPAIFSGMFDHLWLYIVAPIFGALAVLLLKPRA